MKVSEFIQELQKLNPDYEIVLGNSGGYQYAIPVNINEHEEECYIIDPEIY